MTINTDYFNIPIYGLLLIGGTLAGITLNTVLNYMELKSSNKKNIVISEILLSLVCTFCVGSLFTAVTSGFSNFGFSSIGGLIGMYVAYSILSKMCVQYESDKAVLLSNFMLVIPLIYSLTKIGCLFGGCCYGVEYSGLCHIEYLGNVAVETGAIGERFPVQLAESITFMILFVTYCVLRKLNVSNATNRALSLCSLCAIAKLGFDFLRDSHVDQIVSVNQIMCLVILAICLAVYIKSLGKAEHTKN